MNADRQPLAEHIGELRRRLIIVALTVVVGSSIGYAVHQRLLSILKSPLDQQLYYTSPFGGFNAILKISIIFGLIVASPVFIYHLNKFLQPAFVTKRSLKARWYALFAIILATLGVSLGYFVSLPISLHFLTNIDPQNLQPFLVVNDYINFTLNFLGAFALFFQLPLIILLIDHVKPIKPGTLMKFQRYALAGSIILSVLLNPSPTPINLAIMAVPLLLLYQVSVFLIYMRHRKERHPAFATEPVPPASIRQRPVTPVQILDIIPHPKKHN